MLLFAACTSSPGQATGDAGATDARGDAECADGAFETRACATQYDSCSELFCRGDKWECTRDCPPFDAGGGG
jgi:hypothetical protein